MHETTSAAVSVLTEKATGAVIGSAISIAYVFPQGRRDAAIRFFTGVAGGLVFGTTVGVKLAREMGIADILSEGETVMMGSAVASMAIWWVMGFLLRAAKLPVEKQPKHGKKAEKEGHA
ncbi:MAG: DUF6107 family protein [Pseudomonadota bacterium]